MDIEKITKKSKLAKDMVRLGIAQSYDEATKRIDEEELVGGSVREEKPQNKYENISKSEEKAPQEASLNQNAQSQENLNLLINRINMLELQLNKAHKKIEENNQKHHLSLSELKESIEVLQTAINQIKIEWKSAENKQKQEDNTEKEKQEEPIYDNNPPIEEQKEEKSEEPPKNPRSPDPADEFDVSVQKIFNNSGDRITGKLGK